MMLFIVDPAGIIRSVNRTGAAHLGYTPGELAGRSILEIFHERHREAIADQIKNAFQNPESTGYWECQKISKDGSLIWVKEFARALTEDDGTHCLLISCEDITDRKEAEEQLRKAKELSDALNQIYSAIHSTLDFDTIMERVVVDAAAAISSEGAVIGLFQKDLFTVKYSYKMPVDSLQNYPVQKLKGTIFAAALKDVVAFNDAWNDERLNLELVRSQGVRAMMIAPLIVREKSIGALVFYCFSEPFAYKEAHVDFARKLSASLSLALENARLFTEMAEVQERASFFAEAVEKSSQAFTSVYPDGRYGFFNRAYSELTGYPAQDLHFLSIRDVTAPEWHELETREFEKVRRTGEPRMYQKEYLRKDGTRVPVEVKVHRIADEKGDLVCFYAFVTDITERKRTEKYLKGLNEKLRREASYLERAYRDLESFSYAVSHDLKAPARRIEGFAEILLKDYADRFDDYGKDLARRVMENTRNMKQLIDDLLTFSRISFREMKKSRIDTATMARRVRDELIPATGNRRIRFEIGTLPYAYGDPPLIYQVFMNLLSNAVKFTRSREDAVIEVGGHTEEEENIFYVRDNGIGFNMQFADKLFGLFQRIHTQKEFEGTGVGLVIVKKIIEKHGGRVWAEGKVDEGAVFYFALPTAESEDPEWS